MIFTNLIKANLNTKFIGKHIEYYTYTDSTNNDIWELLLHGEAENGTLIITDDQREGRGKKNSRWISSPGKNLTFSFLLKPKISIEKLGLVSLLIGIAIVESIKQFCNLDCKLKWPNDILIENKKFGGILIESKIIKKELYLCIGIGLNVNDDLSQFPNKLKQSSNSLILLKKHPIQREPLLAIILNSIEKLYINNLKIIIDCWLKYCEHLNSKVSFKHGEKNISGIFRGINQNGYAEIECDGNIQIYSSGELTL